MIIKILFISTLLSSQLVFAEHTDLRKTCIEEYQLITNKNVNEFEEIHNKRWNNYYSRCDYKVFDIKPLVHLKNNSNEFIGIEGLKLAMMEQDQEGLGSLTKFRKWASLNKWIEFSNKNHFDWWMFPIGDESSRGYRYSVFNQDIELLKKDAEFINNYREGLRLIFLSWGWDLEKSTEVLSPALDQEWRYYDVRLRKAIHSMYLFDQDKYLSSALKYVQKLSKEEKLNSRSSVFRLLKQINKL